MEEDVWREFYDSIPEKYYGIKYTQFTPPHLEKFKDIKMTKHELKMLASMLYGEARGEDVSDAERASIVFSALNRSLHWKKPLRKVINHSHYHGYYPWRDLGDEWDYWEQKVLDLIAKPPMNTRTSITHFTLHGTNPKWQYAKGMHRYEDVEGFKHKFFHEKIDPYIITERDIMLAKAAQEWEQEVFRNHRMEDKYRIKTTQDNTRIAPMYMPDISNLPGKQIAQ